MYLEWRGEWHLPPLNGVASAPMLADDGGIHSAEGYDAETGMWRENVPDLSRLIPERPTEAQATAALQLLRETFKIASLDGLRRTYSIKGIDDVHRQPARRL